MKTPASAVAVKPWYREPWPWLLMSGPAVVVVAGLVTIYIAVSGQDGLVVDDYYKQGKAINQALHRDDVARQAGVSATVRFDQARDRVDVVVKRSDGKLIAAPLTLSLVHATRSGFDHVVALNDRGDSHVGSLPPLRVGKWKVLLEDKNRQWRLQREIQIGNGPIPDVALTHIAAASDATK